MTEVPSQSKEATIAAMVMDGVTGNAITARAFAKGNFGALDLTECVAAVHKTVGQVQGGDIKPIEAILAAQATTLDTMFTELARRASANMGEYLDAADKYMRLALKAQSQCRATLETLADIKNPRPVAFVKQANISSGPQQVNNGTGQQSPARVEDATSAPNKLLEDGHERLDIGASQAASEADQKLEAVGAVNRTKDDGRQIAGCQKRLEGRLSPEAAGAVQDGE